MNLSTFLNVPELEQTYKDLRTSNNKSVIIRENYKVKKEDALAHLLSDQLLVLSERIQQLERKQMI
ncbi:MAG TPA: hypothetical protein VFP49_06945 [Nitrososphaeraceae archaeon]|nr:hypothetical protein [Nitrososphaeraceae archaeon]